MPECEPRAREAIEHASEHDAQGVRTGLESPFPGRPPQPVVAVQHGRGRDRVGRMQIDERVQCLRPLPDGIERGMIQIHPIGMAVDHGAAELELAHAAFELVRGGGGVLQGKMREAAIAVRTLLDLTREEIVGRARLVARRLDVAFGLHARSRQRQHAAFDAGAIHGVEPHLAEVGQTREKLLSFVRRKARDGRRPIVLDAGAEAVFFDRDLLDHAIPGCSSL